MDCKIKNDIGTIYITEDVLLKVVGYAALECYGIVAMSSKRAKDGIVEWLGRHGRRGCGTARKEPGSGGRAERFPCPGRRYGDEYVPDHAERDP